MERSSSEIVGWVTFVIVNVNVNVNLRGDVLELESMMQDNGRKETQAGEKTTFLCGDGTCDLDPRRVDRLMIVAELGYEQEPCRCACDGVARGRIQGALEYDVAKVVYVCEGWLATVLVELAHAIHYVWLEHGVAIWCCDGVCQLCCVEGLGVLAFLAKLEARIEDGLCSLLVFLSVVHFGRAGKGIPGTQLGCHVLEEKMLAFVGAQCPPAGSYRRCISHKTT